MKIYYGRTINNRLKPTFYPLSLQKLQFCPLLKKMAKVIAHVYPILQNVNFDSVNHMWHATYVFIFSLYFF